MNPDFATLNNRDNYNLPSSELACPTGEMSLFQMKD